MFTLFATITNSCRTAERMYTGRIQEPSTTGNLKTKIALNSWRDWIIKHLGLSYKMCTLQLKLRSLVRTMSTLNYSRVRDHFFFPLEVFCFFGLQYFASSPAITSSIALCCWRFIISCFRPSADLSFKPSSLASSSASAASFWACGR